MELAEISKRLERVERSNRQLKFACGLCLAFPLLAVAGWQTAKPIPEVLQAHRFEVLDPQGVPVVAISSNRTSDGGSIVLRDKTGERRGWFEAVPSGGSMGLIGAAPEDTGGTSIGLSASSEQATIGLSGRNSSGLNVDVSKDQPKIDLWNAKGSLFTAPWKK